MTWPRQASPGCATTLSWIRDTYGIRLNCIVPDWVATDEIREYVDTLDHDQRRAAEVPETLTTLDEIASAVLCLTNERAWIPFDTGSGLPHLSRAQ